MTPSHILLEEKRREEKRRSEEFSVPRMAKLAGMSV